MEDLVPWLRAQLDADEKLFRFWPGDPTTAVHDDGRGNQALWNPARGIVEVDAKRRVVDACVEVYGDEGGTVIGDLPDYTLRALALPYADRPGYRQEWKPFSFSA